MKIGWSFGGDLFGCTAGNGNGINNRTSEILHEIAQPQHFSIKRKDVIVVVAGNRSRIDRYGPAAGEIEGKDGALSVIKNEAFPIRGPVRGLDRIGYFIDRLPVAGGYVE